MDSTFRSAGSRVNVVVGPLVMLIGVGAAITAVVLTLVLGEPGFLALLIPAALALGGGAFVLWGAPGGSLARGVRAAAGRHGRARPGAVGAREGALDAERRPRSLGGAARTGHRAPAVAGRPGLNAHLDMRTPAQRAT